MIWYSRSNCTAASRKVFSGYFTAAGLAAQLQKPVLGEVLGLGQTVFLGGNPPVLSCKVGGALPSAAVVAPVNVDLAAQDRVFFRHKVRAAVKAKLCNACVSVSQGSRF